MMHKPTELCRNKISFSKPRLQQHFSQKLLSSFTYPHVVVKLSNCQAPKPTNQASKE